MTVRVVVADDQALVRTGFRMILSAEPDIAVVGEAVDGETGNDTIGGGAGDDILVGEAGNDTISGDAGDDILVGEDLNEDGTAIGSDTALDVLDGGDQVTADLCFVMAAGTVTNCEFSNVPTPTSPSPSPSPSPSDSPSVTPSASDSPSAAPSASDSSEPGQAVSALKAQSRTASALSFVPTRLAAITNLEAAVLQAVN